MSQRCRSIGIHSPQVDNVIMWRGLCHGSHPNWINIWNLTSRGLVANVLSMTSHLIRSSLYMIIQHYTYIYNHHPYTCLAVSLDYVNALTAHQSSMCLLPGSKQLQTRRSGGVLQCHSRSLDPCQGAWNHTKIGIKNCLKNGGKRDLHGFIHPGWII